LLGCENSRACGTCAFVTRAQSDAKCKPPSPPHTPTHTDTHKHVHTLAWTSAEIFVLLLLNNSPTEANFVGVKILAKIEAFENQIFLMLDAGASRCLNVGAYVGWCVIWLRQTVIYV
jgi:hypothetical protein